MAKDMREPIESGCPDPFQYMHPMMRKNFGMWKYHEHPRPGVLKNVAYSGDTIWTVQAHPEFSNEFLSELMRTRGKGVVPDALLAEAAQRQDGPNDNADIARFMADFLKKERA